MFKEKGNYFNMSILQNYLIFFMILTINLKSNPLFIKTVFRGEDNFLKQVVSCIDGIDEKKKKVLLGIINNLFLEEYKTIYFKENRDMELENLFIDEQVDFSAKYNDLNNNYYEDNTYMQMFHILLDFSISYDNFFKYHQEEIKEEDKPAYKLCVAQSVIRVAFSKEKAKYVSDENIKFYEYYFINRVIEKDMFETKDRFGDEYKTLFRKEDLCDDIIKYMFFIFGNTMIIESFVKPIRKFISTSEPNHSLTKEDFEWIMSEMITKLSKTIPLVLKIVLKLVYKSVRNTFTIEEDDYSPLYTLLIFNFIISPRIQAIYSIDSTSNQSIRALNRLIRNTCYNFKFDEKDSLSAFNELIELNNKKLKSFIETSIMSIEEENDEIKLSLRNLFTEEYLIYPKFLFYWDSKLLCSTIQGGVDNIIVYEELKHSKN